MNIGRISISPSVRSGFGIFDVLPLPYEFEILSLVTAPFFRLATIANLPQGSFPGGAVGIAQSRNSPRRTAYIEPDPHRNYVMQWNLGIEQQMAKNASLALVYVGSRGVHQPFRVDDMNMALPASVPALKMVKPPKAPATKPPSLLMVAFSAVAES